MGLGVEDLGPRVGDLATHFRCSKFEGLGLGLRATHMGVSSRNNPSIALEILHSAEFCT